MDIPYGEKFGTYVGVKTSLGEYVPPERGQRRCARNNTSPEDLGAPSKTIHVSFLKAVR